MLSNQMRLYFKDRFDGASDQEMGFDDVEVSRFLTMGQHQEVQSRLFANRNPYLEGYEVGSKRDNEFSELKTHVYIWHDIVNHQYVIVNQDGSDVVIVKDWEEGIFPNSFIIELPIDFMYFSSDLMDIDYKGVRRKAVSIKSANEDQLAELRMNSFIKPDKRTLYRYTFPRENDGRDEYTDLTARRCMILTDEDTVLRRYYLSYIRQPKPIVVDILTPTNQRHCELNEEIQMSIIDAAVRIALGSIASEKYQISLTEGSLNE